ncbi:filamin A-interacting protein 1-like isoform 1-T2 [Spinachia spinachia]
MTAPGLLSEVELLRRRVVEMEGKDEELIRLWEQCRDLDRSLSRETSHCRSLKVEVDQLNSRISELDRMEENLGQSRQDCSILKGNLEREREVAKALGNELDGLRARVRELEATEGQLEKSEAAIRQDLAQLKSLTATLVEDRKAMAERLRQAEEKLNKKEGRRNEHSNSASTAERLLEERQQALRFRTDLEERIMVITKEKYELQDRLKAEGEKNGELQSKVSMMKKRLQILENRREKDKYMHSSIPKVEQRSHTGDNKVKELTLELEGLQKRLREKEGLQEMLTKVETHFEALQKRFEEEQKSCRALTEELESAKRELARYEQAEKQEVNQEHLLLCRLQKEQVKSRLLGREVDGLKHKLQKLTGTEESICRVRTDHSALQRKLTEQEASNRELAREMKELCSELHRHGQTKRLAPSADRDHTSRTSREVQKERERLGGKEEEASCARRSSLVNNLNSLNSGNNNSQYSGRAEANSPANGEVMMLAHTPGQPLQIKVTPHHVLNTATLEISSPNGDAAASYTSTAVIPTSGASPKQRITIIQNAALSAISGRTPTLSPDRTAVAPLDGGPVSRALQPNAQRCGGSPVQVVTVRTGSPETPEYCESPERQNSWQRGRSDSGDASPSVIAAEDNKIHIHLGSPYGPALSGGTPGIPQPVGPYYLRHEQRTQVLANGGHVKGVGTITSSITISPAASSAAHSSNITVSGLFD